MIALSACGSDGDDASGLGMQVEASLVPVPPTPGAVLYSQASELRPLRDGAAWTYRGHEFALGTVFENVVRQQGSAGALTETHSHDPAMQLTYSLSGSGDVKQSGALVVPWPGKALPIDAIELRSPVRLNEQATQFDGVVDDIGVDLDADKVRDGARVGVYSRVVGNEDVTLPGMFLPLRALRVDTHVVVALRLSGGGRPAPTHRVQSAWYAPGIGPVRTALRSSEPGREFDREQVLVNWDGISEGLGYVSQGLLFPPGTGALAGTPVPPSILALALEDGALVLTRGGDGYAMHRLDLRGALVATRLYPASAMFARAFKFLRLRSGPRLASYSDTGVDLHAFADSGARVGELPVTSFPGSWESIAAAIDADAVWLDRVSSTPIDEYGAAIHSVLLQRFAEGGQPLTAPLVVATSRSFPTLGGYPSLGVLVASSSAAVLSWTTLFGLEGYVAMANSEGTVAGNLGFVDIGAIPHPLADQSRQWVAWTSVRSSLNGAGLDANGRYVLDATGDISAQAVVALGKDAVSSWPVGYAAFDGHLVGIGRTTGEKFWPEDAAPSDWFTLRDLDATASVLSTGAKLVAQVRVPSAGVHVGLSEPPLLFPDRALLLAEKDGQLQSIVVWRR